MKDFYNDEAAANQLIQLLDETYDALVAVLPNSVKIAIAVSKSLDTECIEYWEDMELEVSPLIKKVLVVDDGVETGSKAMSVARRISPHIEKHLAVPVCSREIEAILLSEYSKVYAVKRPFVRRSLDWHYELRPEYTPTEARLLLQSVLD